MSDPLTHQDVVDQRLIGPGVVEGRGHVYVSIHQDKQRPVETGQKQKDNKTQRTQGAWSEGVASGMGVVSGLEFQLWGCGLTSGGVAPCLEAGLLIWGRGPMSVGVASALGSAGAIRCVQVSRTE